MISHLPEKKEKPKILIVDDLDENILSIEKILKPMQEEMEVFKARSGLESIHLTRMHSFALILLDVMMPNMDGFETAARIRKNEDSKNVPIIFLTGFNKDDNFIFSGYEHGAVDYLVKPISPMILASKVKVFLEMDRQNLILKEMLEVKKINEATLIESKEHAEKASISKSQFLAKMSHEIRTPLNAIIGMSQLLMKNKNHDLKEQTLDDIDLIRRSSNHLLTLINEILDLSSIESGNFQINLEPVALVEVLKESIALVKPLSEKHNISINANLKDAENLHSMVDKIRLKQILLNLLSNAIKYNIENGAVTLACKKLSPNAIQISVTDTGKGILENEQDNLFEPFRRFKNMDWQAEGTGIGLSICKKLVESMNGKIDFSSELGKGSRFYIELNICDAPSLDIEDPVENKKATKNIVFGTNKYQVLYIEDNPLNQEIIFKILAERDDIDILTAPLGRLGFELAQEKIPDLILMDIDLPDMNGFEVFQNLQELNQTKDIPVVAVSAHAMKENISKAMDLGFKDYLTKPVDIDLFFSILGSYLK